MLLQGNVAVIYGAGGAVARAFAGEGARGVPHRARSGTPTMAELAGIYPKSSGLTWEQFTGFLASTAHTRRVMALDGVANMAVFIASDKVSGMTGTTVNLTVDAVAD